MENFSIVLNLLIVKRLAAMFNYVTKHKLDIQGYGVWLNTVDLDEQTMLQITNEFGFTTEIVTMEHQDLKLWLANGRKCQRKINKVLRESYESGALFTIPHLAQINTDVEISDMQHGEVISAKTYHEAVFERALATIDRTKTYNVVADIIAEPQSMSDVARNAAAMHEILTAIPSIDNQVEVIHNLEVGSHVAIQQGNAKMQAAIMNACSERQNELSLRDIEDGYLSVEDGCKIGATEQLVKDAMLKLSPIDAEIVKEDYESLRKEGVVDKALTLLKAENDNTIEDAEYSVIKEPTSDYIKALESKIEEVKEQQTYDQDVEIVDNVVDIAAARTAQDEYNELFDEDEVVQESMIPLSPYEKDYMISVLKGDIATETLEQFNIQQHVYRLVIRHINTSDTTATCQYVLDKFWHVFKIDSSKAYLSVAAEYQYAA